MFMFFTNYIGNGIKNSPLKFVFFSLMLNPFITNNERSLKLFNSYFSLLKTNIFSLNIELIRDRFDTICNSILKRKVKQV